MWLLGWRLVCAQVAVSGYRSWFICFFTAPSLVHRHREGRTLARGHKIMSASTQVGQSATTSSLKSGSTGVDDVQLSCVSGILAGPTRRTTLPAEGDTWQPGDGYHGQANLEAKLNAAFNGSEASHVPASCSSRRDNECLGGTSRASLVAANASLVGTYEPPSLHR